MADTARSRVLSYLGRTVLLAGAAVIGQLVGFGGALINARLYGPQEVGVFGLFNAVLGFAVLAASWRYELVIVTVDDEEQAGDAALFVAVMGVLSALMATAVLLAMAALPHILEISVPLRHALNALPPSLLFAGIILAGTNLCIRQRRFRRVAGQQIVLTLLTVGAQIALADTGVPGGGLIAGFIIGQVGATCVLFYPFFPIVAARLRRPRVARRLWHVAHDHRGHLYYTVPYSLMTQLFYQGPLLVLNALFGTREVGLFSLAFRTTTTPLGLVPNALAQVFFPEMARDRANLAAWGPRLLALLLGLGVLLAAPVAAVLVYGPDLYAFALGDRWREAGLFAQILVLPNLMLMLANGYDRIYFVLQRQRAALFVTTAACMLGAMLMFGGGRIGGTAAWLAGGWAGGALGLAALWMGTIYRISGFSLVGLFGRWSVIFAVVAGFAAALMLGPRVAAGEMWPVAILMIFLGAYVMLLLRVTAPLREVLRRTTPNVRQVPL